VKELAERPRPELHESEDSRAEKVVPSLRLNFPANGDRPSVWAEDHHAAQKTHTCQRWVVRHHPKRNAVPVTSENLAWGFRANRRLSDKKRVTVCSPCQFFPVAGQSRPASPAGNVRVQNPTGFFISSIISYRMGQVGIRPTTGLKARSTHGCTGDLSVPSEGIAGVHTGCSTPAHQRRACRGPRAWTFTSEPYPPWPTHRPVRG